MFNVYILQSIRNNRYYIGSTADLNKRIKSHNSGANRSTKNGRPWKIIYLEELASKELAYSRELKIKSYKGGQAFKKLIGLT